MGGALFVVAQVSVKSNRSMFLGGFGGGVALAVLCKSQMAKAADKNLDVAVDAFEIGETKKDFWSGEARRNRTESARLHQHPPPLALPTAPLPTAPPTGPAHCCPLRRALLQPSNLQPSNPQPFNTRLPFNTRASRTSLSHARAPCCPLLPPAAVRSCAAGDRRLESKSRLKFMVAVVAVYTVIQGGSIGLAFGAGIDIGNALSVAVALQTLPNGLMMGALFLQKMGRAKVLAAVAVAHCGLPLSAGECLRG
jgi:zinc transporter ZupT